MKTIKQGLAVVLAMLLAVSPLQAWAGEISGTESTEDYGSRPAEAVDAGKQEEGEKAEAAAPENLDNTGEGGIIEDERSESADFAEMQDSGNLESAGPAEAAESWNDAADEVCFNTGSHVYRVGSASASGNVVWDDCFGEDGSYTINIPEENPFFPYEVQFTYDGQTENRWFMTPGDSVEVNGHTFYVSAYFDHTAVTQMSLNIAGDTVAVYPEEKEFTDGDGAEALSLLPLEERKLRADLRVYTPAEMSNVSMASVFAGSEEIGDTDKIVWRYADSVGYDYTISESGEKLNLSYGTYNSDALVWEMIVGDADQLAAGNIRYTVQLDVTRSAHWLTPVVYTQDSEGNRKEISVTEYSYRDYYYNLYEDLYIQKHKHPMPFLLISVPEEEMGTQTQAYIGLDFNSSIYGSSKCASLRVWKYDTEQKKYVDITDRICGQDMTQADVGEVLQLDNNWTTSYIIYAYDGEGNQIGDARLGLQLKSDGSISGPYIAHMQDGQGGTVGTYSREESEGYDYCSKVTLYEGYHVDEIYYLKMGYNSAVGNIPSAVTAAYVGRYSSIGEAAADGAENIKDILFAGDNSTEKGYGADYSQGVDFTIFVGEDGSPGQKVYHCRVRTEEGTSLPSDYNWIVFSGLKGVDGEDIPCYVVPLSYDSFGSANFYTILVGGEVDVSSLIPVFRTPSGARVFTTGSSVPETSGVSAHDFSKGAVLYTVSQEEGVQMVKNYWLQVVKAKSGRGRLYINSLEDAGAGTREENGVIYSTREVVLDYYHRNRHDILLMNIGTDAIPNLSAELESDVVELDEYWTLKGNYSLPGLSTLTKETEHGELPNFAQLRMKAKDGVEEGTEISGTLTIKSGTEPLMVLTLTGVIGSPRIITEELPQSLKCTLWVPYGTFIQNNNKYSWNKISYSLADGSLPAGMELRENGEIYGVPEETGEFTFTVRMTNSTESFPDDMKTYTLAVERNTDENAEASTDPGYELIQRVPDFQAGMATADSRTLVSVGPYEEFVDIYLDGRKLERGSEYTSEPGSTRITVRSQTLTPPGAAGTHTLGVEFRTKDTGLLKRAAQNYKVGYDVPDNGDSGSGDGNSGGNNGGSGNGGADKDGESGGNGGNADNGGGNPAGEGGVSGGDGPGDDVGAAVSSAVRAVAIAVSTTDTDAVIRYTVKSGDTLWKIAEKFYGAGKYWQKVFEDNRAVIGNPNRIYAGQVIVIYKAQADISARQGNPSAGGSGGSLYTVEAGDTLWKIAREVYGQGWRWRQIYRANADTVREPGDIYAGQALFIPEG